MHAPPLLITLCLGLAGCAGGTPGSPCQVLSPPPASSPAAQSQTVEAPAAEGVPVAPAVRQQDCS